MGPVYYVASLRDQLLVESDWFAGARASRNREKSTRV